MTPGPATRGARGRLPELLLEQLDQGVLAPRAAREVERRMDDRDHARLVALRRSNGELLRRHPPARAARVIERRLASARRPWTRRLRTPAALAATAALALLLWTRVDGPQTSTESAPVRERAESIEAATTGYTPRATTRILGERVGDTTIKGPLSLPDLIVHRKTRAGAEPLLDGAATYHKDVVQVSYIAAGHRSGVIVSLDGRGKVTLHFPSAPDGSTRLTSGGATPLDHAFELDDAPGFERFVLVTSNPGDGPELDVERVLAAAKTLANNPHKARTGLLPLPDGWRQTSFELRKLER